MRCNYDLVASVRSYDHTPHQWRAEARPAEARISAEALCRPCSWGYGRVLDLKVSVGYHYDGNYELGNGGMCKAIR